MMSNTTIGRPYRLAILLASIGCALAIAACGSSGHSKADAASFHAKGLRFSDCMRSHGVPNFPDPSSGGGGLHIKIGRGSGLDPSSPAFKAAQSACAHLLPGGGPGNGHPSAQAKAQLLAMSRCMRAHGVAEFPDPTTTAPSNPSGYDAILGHNGVFLAVPNTINVNSPGFKHAATVCHFGKGS